MVQRADSLGELVFVAIWANNSLAGWLTLAYSDWLA